MTINFQVEHKAQTQSSQCSNLDAVKSWISKILESAYQILICDSTNQPQITPHTSRNDEIFWKIQDPRSGKIYHCETEHDVMVWLESHLYG
jgi:hypothetical protein